MKWAAFRCQMADIAPEKLVFLDECGLGLNLYRLYEWALPVAFDASVLKTRPPIVRALPGLKQCESVCYSSDGKQIFVSSEGKSAPIYAFASAF